MTNAGPRAGALRVSHIWRDEVMADRVLPMPGSGAVDRAQRAVAIAGIAAAAVVVLVAVYGALWMPSPPEPPPPGAVPEDVRQEAVRAYQRAADRRLFYALGGVGLVGLALAARYLRKVTRGAADTSPVTIGPDADAMFTTPDLGLPRGFALIRWGSRGHVLTLGEGMSGTVKLGGEEMAVEDFLARSGERPRGSAGAFRATPISPGDWGLVELDGRGDHKVFFHYVPVDEPLPHRRRLDAELLAPALAFSFVLHGVLLIYSYQMRDARRHSFLFPGTVDPLAQYDIERPVQIQDVPLDDVKAGTEDGEPDAPPASTVGESGKSGGEGDKPRRRAPDPDQGDADAVVAKVRSTGLLRHSASLEKVARRGGFDRRLGNAMARIQGPANNGGLGGFGSGRGTGVGPGEGTGTTRGGTGKGPGGGGTAHGDVVTQGVIKTGGKRPPRGVAGGGGLKEARVQVTTGTASGDFGDLTADQINKVVQSRKNAIRACYERQLQRSPKLSGKIVIRWTIDGGAVTSAKVKSTTMRNGAVEDCIVRQVLRMRFPKPKGGRKAIVNYPFLFAPR